MVSITNDIIIYTNPESLLHKQNKLKGDKDKGSSGIYYWQFSRFPKRITDRDKIYFATEGFIRGYFEVLDMNSPYLSKQDPIGIPNDSVSWFANSWKDIDLIPTKSFQGFKYADKVPELSECVQEKSIKTMSLEGKK